jgi:hypothetical protein
VGQALVLGALPLDTVPARGYLPTLRPDGILLLVVDHDLVLRFGFLLAHGSFLFARFRVRERGAPGFSFSPDTALDRLSIRS